MWGLRPRRGPLMRESPAPPPEGVLPPSGLRAAGLPPCTCFKAFRDSESFGASFPCDRISCHNKTLARSPEKCVLDLLPQCQANKVRMRGRSGKKAEENAHPKCAFSRTHLTHRTSITTWRRLAARQGTPQVSTGGAGGAAPCFAGVQRAQPSAARSPEGRAIAPLVGGAGVLPSKQKLPGGRRPPREVYQV